MRTKVFMSFFNIFFNIVLRNIFAGIFLLVLSIIECRGLRNELWNCQCYRNIIMSKVILYSLRKKCPNPEFFLVCIFRCSDQKNSGFEHFSRSDKHRLNEAIDHNKTKS